MPNLSLADLTTSQLRRAVALREQMEALEVELNAILGVTERVGSRRGRRRTQSRATRGKRLVAKPARNAARRGTTGPKVGKRRRRKMSAAARAKLRASAKARWAAAKA